MKDLLSKNHYCYKIHTSLTKSSAYPPPFSIDNPPMWIIPAPHYYKKILSTPSPPSLNFQKSQLTYKQWGIGMEWA